MLDNWILIGTLEQFSDVIRTKCEEEQDIASKAYKSGKADGLELASNLLREFSKNGYSDNIKFAEVG